MGAVLTLSLYQGNDSPLSGLLLRLPFGLTALLAQGKLGKQVLTSCPVGWQAAKKNGQSLPCGVM